MRRARPIHDRPSAVADRIRDTASLAQLLEGDDPDHRRVAFLAGRLALDPADVGLK